MGVGGCGWVRVGVGGCGWVWVEMEWEAGGVTATKSGKRVHDAAVFQYRDSKSTREITAFD